MQHGFSPSVLSNPRVKQIGFWSEQLVVDLKTFPRRVSARSSLHTSFQDFYTRLNAFMNLILELLFFQIFARCADGNMFNRHQNSTVNTLFWTVIQNKTKTTTAELQMRSSLGSAGIPNCFYKYTISFFQRKYAAWLIVLPVTGGTFLIF